MRNDADGVVLHGIRPGFCPGFFVRIGPGLAALIHICFARSSEHAGASIGNAFDLLRFFAVALARSERFELKR